MDREMLGPAGAEAVHDRAEMMIENIGRVIVGKRDAVTLLLIALFCEGHIILEDVPGVGKTMLAKAAARSLSGSFRRVQFTADLLPSDVTGLNWFNQKAQEFEFLDGPIMTNVLLADEINRATPRTQACLLEAMQERQVTVDGETRRLPRPFLVLATQNPVEQTGTFPLPEAQLDRFLLRVNQGYPGEEEESEIVLRFERDDPLERIGPVLDGEEVLRLAADCHRVYVAPAVLEYLVRVVRATREHAAVRLGASPRATQGLYAAAQARAAILGRDHVLPDDVKALAGPVLAHRLVIRPENLLRGQGRGDIVAQVLETTPAPVEQM